VLFLSSWGEEEEHKKRRMCRDKIFFIADRKRERERDKLLLFLVEPAAETKGFDLLRVVVLLMMIRMGVVGVVVVFIVGGG
jgi:hypothetical protein